MSITSNAVIQDWERLEDERDALAGLLARVETANEEKFPLAVIERLSRCEPPLRVWREYRQLEIADLAAQAGIAAERLAAAETGPDSWASRAFGSLPGAPPQTGRSRALVTGRGADRLP